MSTIVLRGPFTDEQHRAITQLVSDMEAQRPQEVFEVYIDNPECEDTAEEIVAKMTPPRKGYHRVLRQWDRP